MVSKFILLSLFVGIAIIIFFLNNRAMLNRTITYLALGDSYTIGEGVAVFENFPSHAVQLLRKAGHNCAPPELFAKTGWTCADLLQGIKHTCFQPSYQFVSLLIGVNDQYQRKPVNGYADEYARLLEMAIRFTGNKPDNVFVLSIPDWSTTPFASGRDTQAIALDIASFNAVNEQLARQYNVNYITIPNGMQDAAPGRPRLVADGLHPSAEAYAGWAVLLAEAMQKTLI